MTAVCNWLVLRAFQGDDDQLGRIHMTGCRMEAGDAPLWVVRDRWDREIRLHEDTWYNHILPGHRALHQHEAAVAKVLAADEVQRWP